MLKILLADDEYHVINHISNLLQHIDFCEINILNTTSGHDALQIIASSHIDIAFLDINMPQTSGLQIAHKLRNQWPDCLIIFLTAYEIFDYIYEANQFPNTIYLLKAESDAKILNVAISCCRTILQKREQMNYLSDIQRKEKMLLLLQEQQLLREILLGNLTGNWARLAKDSSLDIHFSFEKEVYLMLMHIRHSPSPCSNSSFYLEKMELLLGNLFFFSFIETENGILLWIFQEKDNIEKELSYFNCLKDTMDAFLDICMEQKHQTISLCLYRNKIAWPHLARCYQLLYDSYYEENVLLSERFSVAKVIEKKLPTITNSSNSIAKQIAQQIHGQQEKPLSTTLPLGLSSMKQALYQGNRNLFFAELQCRRQFCTAIKSMHNVSAIKTYFSIVLIYLDYIDHYKVETRLAMEVALYPLYYINDFSDWEHAFLYLRQVGIPYFVSPVKTTTIRQTY